MNEDAASVAGEDASAEVALHDAELAVRQASDVALRRLQDDGFTTILLQQRMPQHERQRAWVRRLVLGGAAGSGVIAGALTLAFEWPRLGEAMSQLATVKVAPELATLDAAAHTISTQSLLHWMAQQPGADVAVLAVGAALLLAALGWMTRAFEP